MSNLWLFLAHFLVFSFPVTGYNIFPESDLDQLKRCSRALFEIWAFGVKTLDDYTGCTTVACICRPDTVRKVHDYLEITVNQRCKNDPVELELAIGVYDKYCTSRGYPVDGTTRTTSVPSRPTRTTSPPNNKPTPTQNSGGDSSAHVTVTAYVTIDPTDKDDNGGASPDPSSSGTQHSRAMWGVPYLILVAMVTVLVCCMQDTWKVTGMGPVSVREKSISSSGCITHPDDNVV